MKSIPKINTKIILSFGLIFIALTACERDLSDEAVLATFPSTADVFTDVPVGLTDQFFVSFDPASGANTENFGTDNQVVFEGTSSIRIDVPAPDDPNGSFIGGIFLDRGDGRNLTNFDALTFYLRGSTTALIDDLGFGTDFNENRYEVGLRNVRLSTDWKKVIIPIPDPSKLVQERGMFRFSAGTQSTNGAGYTFWIDEIRFESLGTIGQLRPSILGGVNVQQEGFIDIPITLTDFSVTTNIGTQDVTVTAAPSYFDFETSENSVALVNDLGVVTVAAAGEATISASLNNVLAAGDLELTVSGPFVPAPTPTRNPEDVISIFSDTYTNVPVDFFNGFFGGSTTQGGAIPVGNNNNVIRYTDLNFVSTQFANPTVNASQMTHLHVDINVQESLNAGDNLIIELGDFGANAVFNGTGSDDSAGGAPPLTNTDLEFDQWVSIDIPLTAFTNSTGGGFTGLASTSNLAQVTFVSSTIGSIFVDNIYFYKE